MYKALTEAPTITSEAEYRAFPALNYSALKNIETKPINALEDKDRKPNEYMINGDIFDLLLLSGMHMFSASYHVYDGPPITPAKQGLCDYILDNKLPFALTGADDADPATIASVLEAVDANDYKAAKVEKTLLKHVLEDSAEYLKQKLANSDKTMISREVFNTITDEVMIMKQHNLTKYWFEPSKSSKLYTQCPIFFNATTLSGKRIAFKGLLDLLIIDHEEKMIEVGDLKRLFTKGSLLGTRKEIMNGKLYLQAAQYSYGLRTAREGGEAWLFDREGNLINIEGYSIELFKNIVYNYDQGQPSIWKYTRKDLHTGTYGGQSKFGYPVRGFLDLADDVLWHHKHEKWEYPKSIYNAGRIGVDVDLFI